MYLTCLRYQSNEHDKWKESNAYKWSSDALAKLAYDQAKRELNGRFVWNIQG